ncbi:MAG: TonB-dependent receptor [Polyangiaceae bacterium]
MPALFRRRSLRVLCGIACALLSLHAGSAAADGTADEADLQFRLGKQEYKKGNFEQALAHFFASNRLVANRNVLFNIAGAEEALGRYADAHRYYVDAMAGETDSQKRAEVQAGIDRVGPHVAVLDVKTDPPGATLFIERKDLGTVGTSPRPLALAAGKYRVLAELPGYEPETSSEVEAIVGKSTSVTLILRKVVGKVAISVEGAKTAAVRVDDEDGPVACAAPCELSLVPGRHDLYFSADGYQGLQHTVVVEPRKTELVKGTLVSLTGTLVVRTEERGAAVKVDGKAIGFTPLVARDIPVGKRVVRVEMPGYRPYLTTLEIKPSGQVDLTSVALERLDEGVSLRQVSAASRTVESLDDAPSSVSLVEKPEIQAFGYPTIYEALRGVRGIALSNDRAYPTAQVRGIGQPGDYGNRFLVLSDGHVLNENVGASSFLAQEARADLGDVERIEIVRGPGSLLYGTGAISGVVNLELRPPDAPSEAHASMGVYDDNVAHARAGFTYNFGKGRSVWASVSAARSDGVDLPVPLPGYPRDALPIAHRVDSFASIGTAGRATLGALTAQWFYHQREQILPVGAYGSTFDDPGSTLQDRRFSGEIRFEPRLRDDIQLFTRAHGNYYFAPEMYATSEGVYHEHYTGMWFGAEARLVVTPRPWLRFSVGADGQWSPEATMTGVVQSPSGDAPYLDEHHPYVAGALYATAEGAPRTWFRFSGGVRLNVYSTFGAVVLPRAALIFHPREDHVLKFMGGHAFRAPSVYELYYNDGGLTQLPGADPARGLMLKPESSWSAELEYSIRFARDWVALAAAHTTVIEGVIGLEEDTSPPKDPTSAPVVRYVNGKVPVFVVGGDVELRREWRGGLMLSAMYGYQRAQRADATEKDPVLDNVPEHLASVRAVVPVLRDLLSVGLRATLEAPRRIRSDSDERTRPAVIGDATISGAITSTSLRYVLGVYNLADWRYEVPVDSTFASRTMLQNGRRFLLDVQYTFK